MGRVKLMESRGAHPPGRRNRLRVRPFSFVCIGLVLAAALVASQLLKRLYAQADSVRRLQMRPGVCPAGIWELEAAEGFRRSGAAN
jgi:hypothetical protein